MILFYHSIVWLKFWNFDLFFNKVTPTGAVQIFVFRVYPNQTVSCTQLKDETRKGRLEYF